MVIKNSLNEACEICFGSQQPRDRFPLSDSRVSKMFEKVRCDLSGSYRHVGFVMLVIFSL